jgi:hypothetical protein
MMKSIADFIFVSKIPVYDTLSNQNIATKDEMLLPVAYFARRKLKQKP